MPEDHRTVRRPRPAGAPDPRARRRAAALPAFVAAVALALAGPVPARADGTATTVPIEALAAAVAGWVADETGLPVPAALPQIRFVPQAAMVDRIARSGGGTDSATDADRDVVALYDTRDATIYLPEGWTGATPGELSVLVHEMVHHLQSAAGETFACPGAREAAAYAAQERWLALHGRDLIEEFGMNRLFLMLVTSCGF